MKSIQSPAGGMRNTKSWVRSLGVALTALAAATGSAKAATITAFFDDFEGTLSQWVDRAPATPQASIKVDPLNASNHVLGFNVGDSGGSIFTSDFVTTAGNFTVEFDYLSTSQLGDTDGDRGGFFGISLNYSPGVLGGDHYWVAGTQSGYGPIFLTDDGQWHHYSVTFASPVGQTVHLMFEDFVASGPGGDAFFDNVDFHDSSVPSASNVPDGGATLGMLGAAFAGLGVMRRRSR